MVVNGSIAALQLERVLESPGKWTNLTVCSLRQSSAPPWITASSSIYSSLIGTLLRTLSVTLNGILIAARRKLSNPCGHPERKKAPKGTSEA